MPTGKGWAVALWGVTWKQPALVASLASVTRAWGCASQRQSPLGDRGPPAAADHFGAGCSGQPVPTSDPVCPAGPAQTPDPSRSGVTANLSHTELGVACVWASGGCGDTRRGSLNGAKPPGRARLPPTRRLESAGRPPPLRLPCGPCTGFAASPLTSDP